MRSGRIIERTCGPFNPARGSRPAGRPNEAPAGPSPPPGGRRSALHGHLRAQLPRGARRPGRPVRHRSPASHARAAPRGRRRGLLAGGPPCRGFPKNVPRSRRSAEDRNDGLMRTFLRYAEVLRPRAAELRVAAGTRRDGHGDHDVRAARAHPRRTGAGPRIRTAGRRRTPLLYRTGAEFLLDRRVDSDLEAPGGHFVPADEAVRVDRRRHAAEMPARHLRHAIRQDFHAHLPATPLVHQRGDRIHSLVPEVRSQHALDETLLGPALRDDRQGDHGRLSSRSCCQSSPVVKLPLSIQSLNSRRSLLRIVVPASVRPSR